MSPISKWSQPERSHSGLKSKNSQPGVAAANAEWTKKILEKNTAKTSNEERYILFLKTDFKELKLFSPTTNPKRMIL